MKKTGKRLALVAVMTSFLLGYVNIVVGVPVYAISSGTLVIDQSWEGNKEIGHIITNVVVEKDVTWDGTLQLDHSCTVTIKGVRAESTGNVHGAPIYIEGDANVNLYFEGDNTLIANPEVVCAGIQVMEGSTVNIYGSEGASLSVTGGKESAGIGGNGFKTPATNNKPAGNINIYSGRIIAKGGDKGAGIGSGYHSSASEINIYGGDIEAHGKGYSAGIGSGYGTSGGAAYNNSGNPTGSGAGYYNGGHITISGGRVRSAAWDMDFDKFNPYKPETLYGEGYKRTHAAGIGGGYGASSGIIEIKGDADVIALGNCGGAGIGTGKGTSSKGKFDSANADCDVTIEGNARVIAMATREVEENTSGDTGAAGIGLGRGWNLSSVPKGKVAIKGKAKVYAYADAGANGIGGSVVVGTFYNDESGTVYYPANAHLSSLTIGDEATVAAICGAPLPARTGLDEDFTPVALSTTELQFDEDFFQKAGIGDKTPFFDDVTFPIIVEACAAGQSDTVTTFSLHKKGTINVGLHFPKTLASGAYYRLRDYEVSKGSGILLAGGEGADNWKFGKGAFTVTGLTPETYNIKYNTNGGTNTASNPASYAVYDGDITLASPLKEGYEFDGWYDNAGLTGSKVTAIPAGSRGDKEFWAKWTKKAGPGPEPTPTPGPTLKGNLLANMKSYGRDSMVFSWNKIKGAEGYDIFLEKCTGGDETSVSKLAKTVKGNGTFTWTVKKLNKNSLYKAVIKAYVTHEGVKAYANTSPVIHAYTSGGTGKYTNAAGLSVDREKVSLLPGQSHKINAKVYKLNSSRMLIPSSHVAKLRYLSSDESIATVNKNGKITAKAKGICTVYAFTANGMSKAIKVIVTPTTTRLSVTSTNVILQQKGDKASVTITAFPDKKVTGEKIIISKNTNKKVVSVSLKNGKLFFKALKKGTSYITAKAGKIKKVIKVNVRKEYRS